MRFTWMLSVLAMALLLSPALKAEGESSEGDSKGVQWLQNYEEAKKQAKDTGKRVFMEFTATW
jgi:thiol:disulfide interchange protein